MKRTIWIFLLFAGSLAYGQNLSFGIEYAQLNAPGMNEMVRTYNFSRPGLTEPQPLLGHGWGLNVHYFFGGARNLKSGIAVNYNRFGSQWENQDLRTMLGFHVLDISYVAHLSGLENLGETWFELEAGILGSLMQKQLEGPDVNEEEQGTALGIGGKISLLAGYRIPVSNGLALEPVLKFGFVPYLNAPGNEILINQTQDLLEDASQYAMTFSAGIRIHL